ncbi:MAG: sortase [Candidatus Saccharimonadales bacterium]
MDEDTDNKPEESTSPNKAADLVREKLLKLYGDEPNIREQLAEAEVAGARRSKHQKFMYDLSHSGRSLADIQTAWHRYYEDLPDTEKHEVWQEFYDDYSHRGDNPKLRAIEDAKNTKTPASKTQSNAAPKEDKRTGDDIKKQLLNRIAKPNSKRGGHLKSLLFGIGCGFIVVFIFIFGLFNERFIAPFISPSKSVSSTPIIFDASGTDVGPDPKIIIPKINVEIPVVYDEPSIGDNEIQSALERGVVHYATTPNPGEKGNGAIFGHSSNNILNKGQYKFAFVLLKRLETGDTFMLQKGGKQYVYRVFDKKVVKPSEVGILNYDYGKPATFSLITCDPPGTSLNRLVVTGEQISPDPAANVASSVKNTQNAPEPAVLPSNSVSLWHRFTSWLTS